MQNYILFPTVELDNAHNWYGDQILIFPTVQTVVLINLIIYLLLTYGFAPALVKITGTSAPTLHSLNKHVYIKGTHAMISTIRIIQ